MNKKILHLQIPFMPEPKSRDDFSVYPETMGKFIKIIQEKLPEFVVVASPCEPSLLSKKDKLYNFNMDQISLKELKDMIKDDGTPK
jgi:hypothetical protein